MVRLKDISARAGVSMMTVSKALREEPDVSAATRARIRQIAQEMGYVPDSAAQGLRSRRTKMFGVVISSITNPVFPRILQAIEERAQEAGYDIIITHALNNQEREERCIRRLMARRVDGLFISPVYRLAPEARIYQEIIKRGTPTVLLDHPAPFCARFPAVMTDDLLASYAATKHLLGLGHRQIAFLTGHLGAPDSQERFEGYRRALREAGLDVDDRLVFNAGSTIEDGEKAGLQMLNENCEATAVQAVNDLVAVGCMNSFSQQGIKVPEDISIIGFGNFLMTEHFRTPLTTVRQAKFRLGEAAVEIMFKLLRREPVPPRRLPAELIVRESTAAPNPTPRPIKAGT